MEKLTFLPTLVTHRGFPLLMISQKELESNREIRNTIGITLAIKLSSAGLASQAKEEEYVFSMLRFNSSPESLSGERWSDVFNSLRTSAERI